MTMLTAIPEPARTITWPAYTTVNPAKDAKKSFKDPDISFSDKIKKEIVIEKNVSKIRRPLMVGPIFSEIPTIRPRLSVII